MIRVAQAREQREAREERDLPDMAQLSPALTVPQSTPTCAGSTELIQRWLPACDGLVNRLERGAVCVAQACAGGGATVKMARAFPRSEFIGLESSTESAQAARARAHLDGTRNVRFVVADAQTLTEGEFDCVAFLQEDRAEAASPLALRRVRDQLNSDGYLLWVASQSSAEDTRRLIEVEGFSRCRVAWASPRNVIIEARP